MPGGWKEAEPENSACNCLDMLAEDAGEESSDGEQDITLNQSQEDKLLEDEASPPIQVQLDPKVWKRGDYMKLWLDSDANTEDKEAPLEIYPGTALVIGKWKDNNTVGVSKLSQFPLGGLEGVFEIVDLNLTIPSFDNSCSKEGVVIPLFSSVSRT